MITLAPWRFRNVLTEEGGPIASLTVCRADVLGERQYQANAFLRPDLMAGSSGGNPFGTAAGPGTASTALVATHKAIAEALERWAHQVMWQSEAGHRYGFAEDPTSNGMAAFPGWRARQARPAAAWEALERYAVLTWWEGGLDARECDTPWPGVKAVVIETELPGVSVVLYRRSANGWYSYGQAAGPDFLRACRHAAGELVRHEYLVEQQFVGTEGDPLRSSSATFRVIEQRIRYFAQADGHACFQERVGRRAWRAPRWPRLVFDGPVPGPWSRYADVWRVLYEPPSHRFLGADPDYFFW